jgi:hypothetical protein
MCRNCGRALSDRLSLRYRLGSDCRSGMTGEQLREALALTARERDLVREQAQPGYIPPARPASIAARATNAEARQVAAGRPLCAEHGGLLGACAQCRAEADPAYGVRRVIREIRAERSADRNAAYAAALAQRRQQGQQTDLFGAVHA